MESIVSLSNALAAIVDAVGPSVVRVEARHRLPASGIIWAADGVIVTAAHVIEHDEHIRVGLADGQAIPAMLVGRDPTTDVAVLRAEASNLRPPAWSEPHAARAGHLVLSLGRPGRTIRATLGMMSAVADNCRRRAVRRSIDICKPIPGSRPDSPAGRSRMRPGTCWA